MLGLSLPAVNESYGYTNIFLDCAADRTTEDDSHLIDFPAMAVLQEPALPEPAAEFALVSLRRERRRWLQKLPHALPAIVLLGAGVNRLRAGEQGLGLALAVGELVVSVLLVRLLMKEVTARRLHASHGHGIDWYDVTAAGVLAAEALEHWHATHHLPRPVVLTAALTLALGLFHRQFAAFIGPRRSLRIDGTGIRVRSRFSRQLLVSWTDIERIDLDNGKARIVARDGRERRIDLADLQNGAEVRQALLAAQARLAQKR